MNWEVFLIIGGVVVVTGYFIALALNWLISKYFPRSHFVARMKRRDIVFCFLAPLVAVAVLQVPKMLSAAWPNIPLFQWFSYGLGFYVFSALLGIAIPSIMLVIHYVWRRHKKHLNQPVA